MAELPRSGRDRGDATAPMAAFGPSILKSPYPRGTAIREVGAKLAAGHGHRLDDFRIATSTGRSGFGPQLSLAYDSGSGNRPYGFACHSRRSAPITDLTASFTVSRAMAGP